MTFANCLGNMREIRNINVDEVPSVAKARKVYEILQFSC